MHDEQAEGNMNTQCDSTGAYTQIIHMHEYGEHESKKKIFFHAVLIHPLVFMSNVRTCYMCTQVPVPRHTRTCKLVFNTQIAADQTPCWLYIHLLVWTFWTMNVFLCHNTAWPNRCQSARSSLFSPKLVRCSNPKNSFWQIWHILADLCRSCYAHVVRGGFLGRLCLRSMLLAFLDDTKEAALEWDWMNLDMVI